MPRVPAYGGRKVAAAPLPNARRQGAQTYESAGGAVGEAIAGLGNTVTRTLVPQLAQLWAQERQHADDVAVLGARNQLAELSSGLLRDPQTGALTVKGGPDVMLPLRDKVLSEFDTKASAIAGSLTNDRQRFEFEKARLAERLQLTDDVERHTFSTLDAYEESETNAYLANSQNAAIASLDPVRIKQEFANQANTIQKHGARLGLGPEAQKALVGKLRSQTHIGVIEGLLAKDQDQRAQLYYDTAKDEIAGDKRAAVEKALEEGTLRGESQRVTDAVMAGVYGLRADGSTKGNGFLGALQRPDGQFSTELSIGVEINGKETEIPTLVPTLTPAEVKTLLSVRDGDKIPQAIVDKAVAYAKARIAKGKSPFAGPGEADTSVSPDIARAKPAPPRPPESLSEALDQVKAIEDPKLRDAVQQRVEHEFVVKREAAREEASDTLRHAYDVVDKFHTVTKIPPAVWTSLDGSDRSALQSYAKSLIEGPASIKTDYGTLYTLITLSSTDPDKFAKVNLLKYRMQLSNGDLEQLMHAQAEARKGKDTSSLFVSEKNQNQMVDEALLSIGVAASEAELRKPENKPLADRVAQFRRAVREAVSRQEVQNGNKPATDQQVQSIIDTLIAPTSPAKAHWFSADEPARYAFETAQAKASNVSQVPAGERRQIERALRARGLAVTDDAIVRLFNEHLAKVRGDR